MRSVLTRMLPIALPLAGALLAPPAKANDDVLKNSANPANWAMQLGSYSGQRFSTLRQIDRDNVAALKPTFTMETGLVRGHEGGPIIIGSTMYIHTPFPNNVMALDMANGFKVKWKYEPKQAADVPAVMCCDIVNRGVAVAEGKVFLMQADNTLVALDAETGKTVWTVKNGDHTKGETSTAAPVVVKDKVIVGVAGGEFGVRGHLTAYDLNTGKQVWRGYSTGPDSEVLIDPAKTTMMGKPIGTKDLGVSTWPADGWKHGGGTTWGWYTYDPKLNLIYYGTGNPGTWNPTQRAINGKREGSDNKWSLSIMARDADTGALKWLFQKTPFDEWDFDGINENMLVDQEMDGKMRKVLVNFDRNGFAYVLDRETGELLRADKYDPVVNWATHVDLKTGKPQLDMKYSTFANGQDNVTENVCPSALGSKDQQPGSYSPEAKLFFMPTNHICMDYEPFQVSYAAGQPFVGATLSMFPAKNSHGGMGNFIAYDAKVGKIVWSRPERFAVWSGALVTSGGIAFYGTLEGFVVAVDQKDGHELWRVKTPSGVIGNINTYEYEGKQYIAVLSGIGGWAGIGLAAGLTGNTDGLGAVGAHAELGNHTKLGGVLTVFGLPDGLGKRASN